MGQPLPLQTSYQGMWRDAARDALPADKVWNSVDYIPEILGAPLRKRGGWTFASTDLGSSTYVDAGVSCNFVDPVNLAIGSDHHVYELLGSLPMFTPSDIGTAFPVAQNPIIHRTGTTVLALILPGDGATAPKSYDGITFQDLAGSPPAARYGAVWNDRAILANGTVSSTLHKNRLWFGPIGDSAGTWETTDAWEDMPVEIVGVAVLKTAILLFAAGATERLTGTTAPSATTTGDLTHDHAFDVGCVDARSITGYNDTVIWADLRGVYQSDGSALKDLTATGGISTYWRDLLASYTPSYTVAGGVINDTYIVSVMDGTTFVDCLAFDLQRGWWFRMNNLPARSFWRGIINNQAGAETYVAHGAIGNVASLSSIYSPADGFATVVPLDGDGTAVQPVLELPFYRGFQRFHRKWVQSYGIQIWDVLYNNYLMTGDPAAAQIKIEWAIVPVTDGFADVYTEIPRVLAVTTGYVRTKRDLKFQGHGVTFRITQQGPSDDTQFFAIEAEYSPVEGSRMTQ